MGETPAMTAFEAWMEEFGHDKVNPLTAFMAGWFARRDVCGTCEGTGIVETRFDPSPAGVSLSPGYMIDEEECPECKGTGKV